MIVIITFTRQFQIKSHFTRLNFEHAHLLVACLSDHSDEEIQTSKEVTLGTYIINSRNFIGSNLVYVLQVFCLKAWLN